MPPCFMVSMLRVPRWNAEYSSVNAPWTYFLSPAGPDRSVVSSNPATGEAAIRVRISATLSFTSPECTNPAETTPPVRSLMSCRARSTGTCWKTDRQRRVRHPVRPRRDVHLPARAPRLVQVVPVTARRPRLRDVLLLVEPGNAQVSGTLEVQPALAGTLRVVVQGLVGLPRPHRRARRPGLLPPAPLLLRPLRRAALLPRRLPAGQVIAARRHRRVPAVTGPRPHGRVQPFPQLRDQRLQPGDPLRLLPDQRVTRILRRAQRHDTRRPTVTNHHPTQQKSGGPECLPRRMPARAQPGVRTVEWQRVKKAHRAQATALSKSREPTPAMAVTTPVWAHLPTASARRVSTAVSNGRLLRCTWESRSPPSSVASRVMARSSGSTSDRSFPSA